MLCAITLMRRACCALSGCPRVLDRDSTPATKISDQRQPNILKQLLSRAVKRHMAVCASLWSVSKKAFMLAVIQSQSIPVGSAMKKSALSCTFAAK